MNDGLLTLSVMILILFFWFAFVIIYYQKKRKKGEYLIFNILIHQLHLGLLQSSVDISIVLSSVGRDANSTYLFVNTIENFITFLLNSGEENLNLYKENKSLLLKLYQEEKLKSPFEGCPSEEKSVLERIYSELRCFENDNYLKSMNELGRIISTRYSEYQKIDRKGKKMIYITILSFVIGLLSFIFGLISILN